MVHFLLGLALGALAMLAVFWRHEFHVHIALSKEAVEAARRVEAFWRYWRPRTGGRRR